MAAHLSTELLERQVREAVQIAIMDSDRIINTHMEFVAPVIQRMTHTNLLDDGRNRGQGQLLERSSFLNLGYISVLLLGYRPGTGSQNLQLDKAATSTAKSLAI